MIDIDNIGEYDRPLPIGHIPTREDVEKSIELIEKTLKIAIENENYSLIELAKLSLKEQREKLKTFK